MPRVSVVIPSHNHEKYIEEAISSVLNQSFQDFEIIIVDDASGDNSINNIKKFNDPRIKLFCFEKNQGQFVTMRKCIEESSGEYIAVLNSDDAFMPDKLEKQVQFLDENPEFGAVFCYPQIIDENGNNFKEKEAFFANIFNQKNKTRHEWLNHLFFTTISPCHPSIMLRKECHEVVGHYDERFGQLSDLDFWIRLCMKYEIHIIPEYLVKLRIRDGEANTGGNRPEIKVAIAWELSHVLKNYLKLDNIDEFLKIFPESAKYKDYIEEDLIAFFVSLLALEVESPVYHKFAMDTLYELLKNRDLAQKINQKYGFSYTDLIKFSRIYDIYGLESLPLTRINSSHVQEKLSAFINKYKNSNKKICFYGAGQSAKLFMELFDISGLNIVGFIDRDSKKTGKQFGDYTIYSLEDLEKLNPDIVVLTVLQWQYSLPDIEKYKKQTGSKFEIIQDLFCISLTK